jgi:hypothetical protein
MCPAEQRADGVEAEVEAAGPMAQFHKALPEQDLGEGREVVAW